MASRGRGRSEGPDRSVGALAMQTVSARGQRGRMLDAWGPFGPWVMSNSTFWFSSSER